MKDFPHLLAEISGPLPHASIVFPVCEHVAARLAIYYLVGCQSLDHTKSKSLTSIWLGTEHCWIASFCSGVNFLTSAELFNSSTSMIPPLVDHALNIFLLQYMWFLDATNLFSTGDWAENYTIPISKYIQV